jgi:hypothetical protein
MSNQTPNPMLAVVLASLVGGGGMGVVLPKVAPSWYRPDPATGHELRRLEGDVQELRKDFHEFLREGPREVRANQTRILSKLEAIEKRLDALESGT